MKSIFRILIASVTVFFYGCATILSGTSQDIMITTSPSAVTVFKNGIHVGKAPVELTINRKDQPSLTFQRDGYKDSTITLERSHKRLGFLPLAVVMGYTLMVGIQMAHEISQPIDPGIPENERNEHRAGKMIGVGLTPIMVMATFSAGTILSLPVIIADHLLGGAYQHEETIRVIMEPESTDSFDGEDDR
tara:strand:- start:42 stop:611 length:570 start_codon:yes stop_codon:yes gene_type:complete